MRMFADSLQLYAFKLVSSIVQYVLGIEEFADAIAKADTTAVLQSE